MPKFEACSRIVIRKCLSFPYFFLLSVFCRLEFQPPLVFVQALPELTAGRARAEPYC